MARKQVTEEDVMKALGALDEEIDSDEGEGEETAKSVAPLPKSTKQANGGEGLSKTKGGEGKEADVDVEAEESEDGTGIGKSDAADEEEVEEGEEEVEEGEEEEPEAEEAGIEGVEEIDENDLEEPTTKSVRDSFRSNEVIRKGVEVSPFLESLTDVFGEEMDKLGKSIDAFQTQQDLFNARLQKAVIAIGNATVQIGQKVDAFGEQPQRTRKSVLLKSEVQDREFEGGDEAPQFSKSEVLSTMFDLVTKGELPALAVSTYETTSFIDPAFVGLVSKALKATKAG
jgi:hypothetical protein